MWHNHVKIGKVTAMYSLYSRYCNCHIYIYTSNVRDTWLTNWYTERAFSSQNIKGCFSQFCKQGSSSSGVYTRLHNHSSTETNQTLGQKITPQFSHRTVRSKIPSVVLWAPVSQRQVRRQCQAAHIVISQPYRSPALCSAVTKETPQCRGLALWCVCTCIDTLVCQLKVILLG